MQVKGTYRLKAQREQVWEALNRPNLPDSLQSIVPIGSETSLPC